jgi:HD-GYP domain-containing protein (c-di-GMP phosphodiesterase class II)
MSEALEFIKTQSGKQFDPRIVEAALGIPENRWAELLEYPSADTQIVPSASE